MNHPQSLMQRPQGPSSFKVSQLWVLDGHRYPQHGRSNKVIDLGLGRLSTRFFQWTVGWGLLSSFRSPLHVFNLICYVSCCALNILLPSSHSNLNTSISSWWPAVVFTSWKVVKLHWVIRVHSLWLSLVPCEDKEMTHMSHDLPCDDLSHIGPFQQECHHYRANQGGLPNLGLWASKTIS